MAGKIAYEYMHQCTVINSSSYIKLISMYRNIIAKSDLDLDDFYNYMMCTDQLRVGMSIYRVIDLYKNFCENRQFRHSTPVKDSLSDLDLDSALKGL